MQTWKLEHGTPALRKVHELHEKLDDKISENNKLKLELQEMKSELLTVQTENDNLKTSIDSLKNIDQGILQYILCVCVCMCCFVNIKHTHTHTFCI